MSSGATGRDAQARVRFHVGGVVQGVGFRPFVYRLACSLSLSGWVRNTGAGVDIEVEGEPARLDAFRSRLLSDAPPLASIASVTEEPRDPRGDRAFAIDGSESGTARTQIGHDAATCEACLSELFDPRDRRYRYAFVNCTHCGPRYTITRALPYDRRSTSMAAFALCPECRREYADPADRRFHAEPNACPRCGPHLSFVAADGGYVAGDAIELALDAVRDGRIVAAKGLGGFHLLCDARNAAAVARLRSRKLREEKPFAVMLANAESCAGLAAVGPAARAALSGTERPIVLLDKLPGCDAMLAGVAPDVAELGVMLPYTPLHHLLFHEAAGRPDGTAWLRDPQRLALVATSANRGGEPILSSIEEAVGRLGDIADAFLTHDREIVARCEDSVVRADDDAHASGAPALRFVRRGRGYAPHAISLGLSGPPTLSLGNTFKNTIALTRGSEAFLSPHIGDLDTVEACDCLEETVGRLEGLLDVRPELVVHDLHPDSAATRLAVALSDRLEVPRLAVQHHHAHVAAVLAEHRFAGSAIGLALDGVGYGSDGRAWGGELVRVDGATFERLGHLRELALPGGDKAAREPWRMAASALHAMGRGDEIVTRFPKRAAADAVAHMLRTGLRCPPTSSAGRWFDAVAGLLGIREVSVFEGQAPMLLEARAARRSGVDPVGGRFSIDASGNLDLLPVLESLADEPDADLGAARFHASLVDALDAWVGGAVERDGPRVVALGGGCFLNRVLTRALAARLRARGLVVLEALRVPPSDGGLSLGQAWIALQSISQRKPAPCVSPYPLV